LRQRLAQHKAGQVRSTKGHLPLELVYYEAYDNATDARKREIELKTNSQQKEILFKRLAQSLNMALSSNG
ncbi:MAG: GIY-YIG nuclease family protein, partial [Candidatus Veblenbacteria bacterium]|nr:GIY-YIG nuclease family protein [Candidatus Veblenbacteria bacterium]